MRTMNGMIDAGDRELPHPARSAGRRGVQDPDERVLVKSFYQGVEYLYRLVKDLSGGR